MLINEINEMKNKKTENKETKDNNIINELINKNKEYENKIKFLEDKIKILENEIKYWTESFYPHVILLPSKIIFQKFFLDPLNFVKLILENLINLYKLLKILIIL